jgi:hypothetical protein
MKHIAPAPKINPALVVHTMRLMGILMTNNPRPLAPNDMRSQTLLRFRLNPLPIVTTPGHPPFLTSKEPFPPVLQKSVLAKELCRHFPAITGPLAIGRRLERTGQFVGDLVRGGVSR